MNCCLETPDVHLVDGGLERVVPLADARRGEGVRRGEVGAGREVRIVDLGDDLRPGEVQQIRVAPDVARVLPEQLTAVALLREPTAVDEHAPGAVVDDDALVEDLAKLVDCAHHVSFGAGRRMPREDPAG